MSDDDLAEANEQLRKPPEFKLSSTARLGLFVVGRLAERHGLEITLHRTAASGTTVIVLIPDHLISSNWSISTPKIALPSAPTAPVTSPQRTNGERAITASGLPLRTRKASRSDVQTATPEAEQARRLMASYQLGSRRARFEKPEDLHGTADQNDG